MPTNRYYSGPHSPHYDGLRFSPPGGPRDKKLKDVAKMLWRTRRVRKPWPRQGVVVDGDAPPERVEGPAIRIAFVGHASFLVQTEGVNLLIDPIWSHRVGPGGIGPKRVTPPGLAFERLPEIDAVLVSHNHYDHMDVATLARLAKERPAPVLTPLGNDAILRRADKGIEARSFDWGQSVQVGALKIHFEPTYHWSARGRADRRMALWASFVIEGPSHKIFYAGDTAFRDGALFSDIGRRHGPFRLALLPIGAYAPRWFMRDQHIDPEEAVEIFKRLGAQNAFAYHWGTFRLTEEPYDEPPIRLRRALAAAGIAPERFRVEPAGASALWE